MFKKIRIYVTFISRKTHPFILSEIKALKAHIGANKQKCTATLAITANGRNLQTYVIFKHKNISKESFLVSILIKKQENDRSRMDSLHD